MSGQAVNRSGGPWIDPAETVARGVASNGTDFLTTWVRLPPLDREAHAMGKFLWPIPLNEVPAVRADVSKASAALGTQMRRVGEVVAAKKRANADAR